MCTYHLLVVMLFSWTRTARTIIVVAGKPKRCASVDEGDGEDEKSKKYLMRFSPEVGRSAHHGGH